MNKFKRHLKKRKLQADWGKFLDYQPSKIDKFLSQEEYDIHCTKQQYYRNVNGEVMLAVPVARSKPLTLLEQRELLLRQERKEIVLVARQFHYIKQGFSKSITI